MPMITFEGGEGAGKSTQVQRLAETLASHLVYIDQADADRWGDIITTREPGGSPGAEEIRRLLVTGDPDKWDPVTEALLFSAARRDHYRRVIEPRLAKRDWIICDRFTDTTIAYQGYAGNCSMLELMRLQQMAIGPFQPDLTFIFDVPIEVGLERCGTRYGGTERAVRFESKGRAYHERLRQGFLEIAKENPKRCRLINATGPIDEVADVVWSHVMQRFFPAQPLDDGGMMPMQSPTLPEGNPEDD